MKMIPVREAVGHVLCHDITQIIPGGFKGRRFAKGHIITEEDIPVLLSLGKDNIYVWEMNENMVHENDAAVFLKDIAMGSGLTYSEIKEGKIIFYSSPGRAFESRYGSSVSAEPAWPDLLCDIACGQYDQKRAGCRCSQDNSAGY